MAMTGRNTMAPTKSLAASAFRGAGPEKMGTAEMGPCSRLNYDNVESSQLRLRNFFYQIWGIY